MRSQALKVVHDMFAFDVDSDAEEDMPVSEIKIQKTIERIVENILSNGDIMCNVLDIKNYDDYIYYHSINVAMMSVLLGANYGMNEESLYQLTTAAILHDIGKIAVPDAVLNKPSRLTDGEYELMKKHTIWGKEILAGLEFLPQADMGAAYHHERFDGKGYPYGIKGDKIPDIVRIISAADSLDAMSSNRCYRRHCDKDYIISEFEKGAGTQFDADVAQVVVELIKEGRIIL